MITTNAFTTRKNNSTTIQKLYNQLKELYKQDRDAYRDYLEQLELVMRKDRTPMKASQIAAKLATGKDERKRITCSIAALAAAADIGRDERKMGLSKPLNPSISHLHKKVVPTVRRFAELDENGLPIRVIEKTELTNLYYWED